MKRKGIQQKDIIGVTGTRSHMPKTPQELDEESIGGAMAGPESDDDVLEAAHQMGIGLDEDYEHPRELDIAGDMDKAEKYKRTH
jgi:hypothetical protein